MPDVAPPPGASALMCTILKALEVRWAMGGRLRCGRYSVDYQSNGSHFAAPRSGRPVRPARPAGKANAERMDKSYRGPARHRRPLLRRSGGVGLRALRQRERRRRPREALSPRLAASLPALAGVEGVAAESGCGSFWPGVESRCGAVG